MRTPAHAGVIAMVAGKAERGKDLIRQALALNPAFGYAEAQDAKRRLGNEAAPANARATNPQIVLH
jgi:hypothetical protein